MRSRVLYQISSNTGLLGHLLLKHGNPYSLNEVLREQQNWGWKERFPLMFLSPPWALVFIAPLGLTNSYAMSWLLWTLAMAAVVALSSRLLMDVYFDELRIPEISDTAFYRCLFAFTFYPVLLCFKFAQTAPLMLLGLAGFLWFGPRNRSVIAGAALSLTLIKPQLFYLIWIALFLVLQQRRWKILASATCAIAGLTLVALLIDHKILVQYWELARGPYAQVITLRHYHTHTQAAGRRRVLDSAHPAVYRTRLVRVVLAAASPDLVVARTHAHAGYCIGAHQRVWMDFRSNCAGASGHCHGSEGGPCDEESAEEGDRSLHGTQLHPDAGDGISSGRISAGARFHRSAALAATEDC